MHIMEPERGYTTAGYTISEVAEATGLTAHTLRYYERAGLLEPPSRGWNGHRRYSELDVGILKLLTRLKATGMSIAGMRRYAELCRVGPETFDERRELLEEHRRMVLDRIAELRQDLRLIDYKIDVYRGTAGQADQADVPPFMLAAAPGPEALPAPPDRLPDLARP
jgi:DNA-binding transcriptional MerR regulator